VSAGKLLSWVVSVGFLTLQSLMVDVMILSLSFTCLYTAFHSYLKNKSVFSVVEQSIIRFSLM